MDKLFLKNFLRNPLRNASIIPSSRFASVAMFRNIDFSKIKTVIELGPGTGVFTKQIVEKSATDTKIILIELESSYIANLRKQFGSRVVIENTDANSLENVLKKHSVKQVDLIISSLPFEAVNFELVKTITKMTKSGTIFRFFTYIPPAVKRVYKDLPIKIKSFVLRNIPPLWIYGVN